MATIRDKNGRRVLLGSASWLSGPPSLPSFTVTTSPSSGPVGTSPVVTITPNAPWVSSPVTLSTTLPGSFAGNATTRAVAVGTTTPVSIAFTPSGAAAGSFNGSVVGMVSTGFAQYTVTASAGAATLLHSFTVQNNNASGTSPVFLRRGVPFKPGDVPAGTSVQVRRGSTVIDAQFDELVYRNPSSAAYAPQDGSLRFAVMHLRDTVMSASESRTYDVWSVPGVAFSNVGTKTLADVTGTHDLKVAYSSLTETNDVPTTTAVGSGNFTASLNAHAAVATRTEKFHSGAVCEGWMVWGMATDNAGGAADAHLKVNHYVDVWKNADGSVYGVEYGPETAQDWWSVPNKRRRNYDAAVKDGATTLVTYNGVVHPYASRWLGVQNAGDTERGKRLWVGGAAPTLNYVPDRTYWIAAGVMPHYKLSEVPAPANNPGSNTYVPCGPADQRGGIDGTGDYDGRGYVPNTAAMAFIRGDAAAIAVARINGLAGLGCSHGHYRSNNQRTRPGEAADIANTPISQIMNHPLVFGTSAQVPYDFTAKGMPAPTYCYTDGRTDPTFQNGYTYSQGPDPYWNVTTGDPSHSVNYSGFMYMHDGERYFLESVMDQANNMAIMGIGNLYSARPVLSFAGNLGNFPTITLPNDPGINNGSYDAVAGIGQERSLGWTLNCYSAAVGFTPNTHVACDYFKRLNRQLAIYLHDTLAHMPNDAKLAGAMPWNDSNQVSARWMSNFTPLCGYANADFSGDQDILAFVHMVANPLWPTTDYAPFLNSAYRTINKPVAAPWDATTNSYIPVGRSEGYATGPIAAASDTLTLNPDNSLAQWGMANGDVLYWQGQNQALQTNPPVPGVSPGVPFYVINYNSTAQTFQLSTSPGGAPFDFTQDAANVEWSGDCKALTSVLALSTTDMRISDGSNGYSPIARAAMVNAYLHNHPLATQTLMNKMMDFVAPITITMGPGSPGVVSFNYTPQ